VKSKRGDGTRSAYFTPHCPGQDSGRGAAGENRNRKSRRSVGGGHGGSEILNEGYVTDFLTGKRIKGFIEDPAQPGQYLCNVDGCRRPTGHHNYAVCWEHTSDCFRELRAAVEHADRYYREFMASMGIAEPPRISSSRARIEIVMQGEPVRKARELHAARKRKPLMGERLATGCGEIDLEELS
jgi:hypothetical protein